jgi:hypothetical protein
MGRWESEKVEKAKKVDERWLGLLIIGECVK